jgi:glycosyltransferase involved in cell wall biosynthesis
MKVALVAHIIPPMWSGNPVVLSRLFGGIDPSSYCVISRMRPEAVAPEHIAMPPLPARHHHVTPGLPLMSRRVLGAGALRERVSIPLGILLRARRIARIVRRERCDAIVACTGGEDLLDLPAAYLASRMTGARYYPWMFDHYEQQWRHASHVFGRSRRWPMIGRMIRAIMRGATSVIAPNEFTARLVEQRYGGRASIVRNPVDMSAYPEPDASAEEPSAPVDDELRIVFTGAVYEAHFDAFRNLIAALRLPGARARLHIYTALAPEHLAAHGISGPVEIHAHLAADAVPAVQQTAGVLFLPLAFDSPFPELVRTSSPGKFGEYLAAGRPILAHVPADSFVAWYLREHDAALVVDRQEPAALREAIDRLACDRALRSRLAASAWRRASIDFEVSRVRAALTALLGIQ